MTKIELQEGSECAQGKHLSIEHKYPEFWWYLFFYVLVLSFLSLMKI